MENKARYTKPNSRQRRRVYPLGDGNRSWVKTTPVGVITREETPAEISHKSAIANMQRAGSYVGGYMMSKHQGSKPQRILKRYMGYDPEKQKYGRRLY